MAATILPLPDPQPSGFSNRQFRRLDALFLEAVQDKTLMHRAVSCDFDKGVARFTFHKTEHQPPVLEFRAVRAGPRHTLFELYKREGGLIARSALFDRVYDRLEEEIRVLGPHHP